MNNKLFDNKKNNKKVGLAFIAVMVIIFIMLNVKIQSVSEYKSQQQNLVNEYTLNNEKQSRDIVLETQKAGENLESGNDESIIAGEDTVTIISSENQSQRISNSGTQDGDDVINSSIGEDTDNNVGNNAGNAIVEGDNVSNETDSSGNSEDYVTCSIIITCDALSNNMDKWTNTEKNAERIIPGNGIILDIKDKKVKKGSSVLEVLRFVAEVNDISIVTGFNSDYVTSINHIAEKDAGNWSGWMYKVNEIAPKVGSSSVKVNNGDNILFYYVIEE